MDLRAGLQQNPWLAFELGEPVTCMPKVGEFKVHRLRDGPSAGSMADTKLDSLERVLKFESKSVDRGMGPR